MAVHACTCKTLRKKKEVEVEEEEEEETWQDDATGAVPALPGIKSLFCLTKWEDLPGSSSQTIFIHMVAL